MPPDDIFGRAEAEQMAEPPLERQRSPRIRRSGIVWGAFNKERDAWMRVHPREALNPGRGAKQQVNAIRRRRCQ